MTGTPDTELVLINEAFYAERVEADELDDLLANGWRHFGERFQRYSLNYYSDEIRRVLPLRVRLSEFRLSKGQRRVLKKNEDVRVEIVSAEITADHQELFLEHRRRFTQDVPDSLYTFVSDCPSMVPTDGMLLNVSLADELIAASFFEMSTNGLSSIYGMFAPRHAERGLGTFTMLKEIEYAREHGKAFYYHGYAYEGESFYDYKKRFSGLETFDWRGNWKAFKDK
ncbi:MAG TPA: GNAT family N-acetyltransferase [Pyrinomonadaceae bacterium]|nr:GNAT family N-acetyltransferase [Pyrinomonadaceae bacterium]